MGQYEVRGQTKNKKQQTTKANRKKRKTVSGKQWLEFAACDRGLSDWGAEKSTHPMGQFSIIFMYPTAMVTCMRRAGDLSSRMLIYFVFAELLRPRMSSRTV